MPYQTIGDILDVLRQMDRGNQLAFDIMYNAMLDCDNPSILAKALNHITGLCFDSLGWILTVNQLIVATR